MSYSKRVFISGTGTGIGKTLVTGLFGSFCVDIGLSTAVVKPVQTGTDSYTPDLDIISGMVDGIIELPATLSCPYSFGIPASPHFAAERAGEEVLPEKILETIEEVEQEYEPDILLIEGAGGILVPLTRRYMTIDMVKELNGSLIIVSDPFLGTINHTLLTMSAVKHAGISKVGIIFNRLPENPSPIELDSMKTVESLSSVPILATIPEFADLTQASGCASVLNTENMRRFLERA